MTIFTWTGKAKDWLKVANRFKNKFTPNDWEKWHNYKSNKDMWLEAHDCHLSEEDGCDCVKL